MKQRHRLRKDEIKQLAREVGDRFGEAGRLIAEGVEISELEDGTEIIFVGGKGLFFRTEGGLFPTLLAADFVRLQRVVIDMGAVPHVVNGADVMTPGIVSADVGIKNGEAVWVVDERYGKLLAVGLAILPGMEMKAPKGKAIKNLHHIGDEVWRSLQEKG